MIKFSVVVVCLNAGNDLIDTINSILNQTYQNYEVIVKDGLSSDGSISLIPKDNRIKFISESDSGIYAAMNQAINFINGDYVIFLNCGDLFYDNDVLLNTAEAINNNKYDIFYGDCYNVLQGHYNSYPQKITSFTCYRTMICHQSTFYAKEILSRGYDLKYRVLADRELLVSSIVKDKKSTKYLNFTVCRYKAGGFCETPESINIAKREEKTIKKNNYNGLKRIKYELLLFFTMRELRALLIRNEKFRMMYYKTLKRIYSLNK
ncbi:glycosyltransferase family 2 protein [Neobacillus vireti]|uniref:glycosyltransferase family 2 protein n=1 Tax=Neobacillus vireti TaxID=220686 RepID=UPI002FFE8F4D